MKWSEIGEEQCSLARSLSVIGDRWTMLVLRQAFAGTRRFNDFSAQLGMSTRTLANRLQTLVDAGVLSKQSSNRVPDQPEYRLTKMGRGLYPVVIALFRWGDTWLDRDKGPPVVFMHNDCGHDSQAIMVCSHCAEPLDPRSVTPHPGPGLDP